VWYGVCWAGRGWIAERERELEGQEEKNDAYDLMVLSRNEKGEACAKE